MKPVFLKAHSAWVIGCELCAPEGHREPDDSQEQCSQTQLRSRQRHNVFHHLFDKAPHNYNIYSNIHTYWNSIAGDTHTHTHTNIHTKHHSKYFSHHHQKVTDTYTSIHILERVYRNLNAIKNYKKQANQTGHNLFVRVILTPSCECPASLTCLMRVTCLTVNLWKAVPVALWISMNSSSCVSGVLIWDTWGDRTQVLHCICAVCHLGCKLN